MVRTIALIGASNKPERPSYGVMQFLLAKGFTVYPVNPALHGQQILGQRVYVSLAQCPAPIDMVDIFRNTEAAQAVIDEAIMVQHALQIKIIWCQLGVMPEDALRRARKAGLITMSNRCPAIEWRTE